MKLEFESNAVSSPLVGNHLPAEFDEQHSSPEVMEMLREGIKAAQDGDRAEARNLLLRVTEADAKNENAWLWLASISEYPEELLVFLNNVLQINPDNERAQDWAKATKSLIAKTFVQRGIDSAKDDQKQFAKQCFLQAIVHDPASELAYLWLASVADSTEEKMSHLQKVLSLNPKNENALSSLKNAKEHKAKALLPKANTAAISGRREEAVMLLEEIFEDAPDFEDAWMLKAHLSESFDEKIEAFERVLEINPENPVARANVDSLRMFANNSEAETAVPMPSESFEDSQAIFGTGMHEEPATSDSSEPVDEPVTEQFVAEEESVAFEDVAPALDQADEDGSEDVGYFESEELSLADAENEQPDAAFFDESEEEPPAQPEDADEQSFESKAEEVDHDYVSENVDFAVESVENPEDAELEAKSESEDADLEVSEDQGSVEQEYQADSNESAGPAEEDGEAETSFESNDEPEMEAQSESAEEQELEADAEQDEEPEMEAQSESEKDSSDAAVGAKSDEEGELEAKSSSEPEMPSFDTAESLAPEYPSDHESKYRACQYCSETNEYQAFACHSCKAIFTISDIEMILSHTKANKDVISKALEKMEVEKSLRGVDVEELKHLGIGYLNLKEFRKGFEYLQEAAKKDKNDVILVSQIDALAVRLAEIEDHERGRDTSTAGKKILVVDDSPTVRKLISGKLEKCGHEPVCAVDGMDALAKINEEVPDLILLDITMPRMDGYQVCKLIRSNDATKDVPVVMISGKDGFFDKVRGRMAGTSNYITKPFGPETLMKTVNEYIQ